MDCVSFSHFSLLLDGPPVRKVTPFQGLHQGCPLSPYRFLLCAEGFLGLLKKVEKNGTLSGISYARRVPKISVCDYLVCINLHKCM